MEIRFLGGGQEVGRSAILINENLLLDYGIKPTEPPTYPVGALNPNTVIISHGHLDHCGLVPNLMDIGADIYCTPMTKRLTILLALDTVKIAEERKQIIPFYNNEIKEFERQVKTKAYNKPFMSNGYEICFFDAGHIPGSSMIQLNYKDESLFYTGDINTTSTELQNGAELNFPKSKVLMIESTYFGKNHVSRRDTEKRFIKSIKDTLRGGGHAIIPAFAIGRTQEIMMVLKKNGIFAHVDGMGVDVAKLIKKDTKSILDTKLFLRAFGKEHILKPDDREEILNQPSVIVTTAGMLNGGPVLFYIDRLADDPKSKILLTGYQAEKTNGRLALEKGIIKNDGRVIELKCQLEQYNFSAHAGDIQLKDVVRTFVDNGTETVIPIHGDHTDEFAKWIVKEFGIKAIAPRLGEKIIV